MRWTGMRADGMTLRLPLKSAQIVEGCAAKSRQPAYLGSFACTFSPL